MSCLFFVALLCLVVRFSIFYAFVHVSVCLLVSAFICVFASVCLCLFQFLTVSVCFSVCVHRVSVWICVFCLFFVSVSARLFDNVWVCVHLWSFFMFVCFLLCLCICLFVCACVCFQI